MELGVVPAHDQLEPDLEGHGEVVDLDEVRHVEADGYVVKILRGEVPGRKEDVKSIREVFVCNSN